MTHQESSFTNAGGLNIYTQAWLPQTHEANMLIAHGVGEHSGRYAHVANYFNQKGVAVFALDHQGHGKSQGKRGHVPEFQNFVEDMQQLCGLIHQQYPNKPTFLYGHSMGGLIVFLYLLKHQEQVDAAIISAPPVKIKLQPSAVQKVLLGVMKTLAPSFTLNNDIDAAWLSREKDEVEAYRTDPLVHPKISVALFTGMVQGGQQCLEKAASVIKPVLMVIGGEDKIIDGSAAYAAFEKISSEQKKQVIFEGSYHEIHNDLDRLKEFETMWKWTRGALGLS